MKKLVAWVKARVAPARKALVAVAGVAAQVVALGVVHGTLLHYVQGALGVLAAVGVYAVPNAKKPVTLTEVAAGLKQMTAAGASDAAATEHLAATVRDLSKPATPAADAKPDAAK